jgi:hypothetical protein
MSLAANGNLMMAVYQGTQAAELSTAAWTDSPVHPYKLPKPQPFWCPRRSSNSMRRL